MVLLNINDTSENKFEVSYSTLIFLHIKAIKYEFN